PEGTRRKSRSHYGPTSYPHVRSRRPKRPGRTGSADRYRRPAGKPADRASSFGDLLLTTAARCSTGVPVSDRKWGRSKNGHRRAGRRPWIGFGEGRVLPEARHSDPEIQEGLRAASEEAGIARRRSGSETFMCDSIRLSTGPM